MLVLTTEQIAFVCHEANRALTVNLNNPTIPVPPHWNDATPEQRKSVRLGVENIITGAVASPTESHQRWCQHKFSEGWVHGALKDEAAKTHPLLVPYEQLSAGNRLKDEQFFAIVKALAFSAAARGQD